MLRLHDFAASANCYKVRLLLAQLGIEYERVPVDLFAGESQTDAYLAKNPAGRAPVLELDSGDHLAESGAILLLLAEGTPLLPDDRLGRARATQWLFFEQNLLEPNIGTARFWLLTGRAEGHDALLERWRSLGRSALAVLERQLARTDFLLGEHYSVSDIGLYAYTHVASEAGLELPEFRAVEAWLRRVEATSGFINDLEPYPKHAGRGGRSAHG
ncbi:MAG: glutathione S-transferase family protein [Actinobacteria bacterium]|nr:glutathione S-transferase family protein [Actinomycetota bacterium]